MADDALAARLVDRILNAWNDFDCDWDYDSRALMREVEEEWVAAGHLVRNAGHYGGEGWKTR